MNPGHQYMADRRAAWLEERRGGIGGSDAAVVLGQSPWGSRYPLWAEKVGLVDSDVLEPNSAADWGLRHEPSICQALADFTGRHVAQGEPYTLKWHPKHKFMFATLDAIVTDDERGPGVLQIKTTNIRKAADWENGAPLHYQIQLQHEIAVTGLKWGCLACLVGGQELVWRDFERNDRFLKLLIQKEREFWKLVEDGTPPPVDGGEDTARALAKLFGSSNGSTISLPAEALEVDTELVRVKEQLKALEQRREELSNQIKAWLGGCEVGLLPDGTGYSWKEVVQNMPAKEAYQKKFRMLKRIGAS